MARDATARLYDVDEDTVVFKKLEQTKKYDQGRVTFQARKGKLIDLDKLHESIFASRLSDGTRSGLVSLVVTVKGAVDANDGELVVKVAGSSSHFVLGKHPEEEHSSAFDDLQSALSRTHQIVSVTGQIDGWMGRWPKLLPKLQKSVKPRRILVTAFETADSR